MIREMFPNSIRPPVINGHDILDCIDPSFNTFVKLPKNVFTKVNSISHAIELCKSSKKSNIYEIPGNINDLIESVKYGSVAALFSADLTMVSGIERKMSDAFKMLPILTKSKIELGKVVKIPYSPNNIYCMFSRNNWWERSSYSALLTCLNRLLLRMLKTENKLLFVPRLGYGVDGLDWNDVKSIINHVFRRTNIKIISMSMKSDKKTLTAEPKKPKRNSRKTLYKIDESFKWFTDITNK